MAELNDEVSLYQLVSKIRRGIKYIYSKRVILIFIGILCAAVGFLYAFLKKPTYSASLIFVLSNDSKNSSGLANLAGQFGVDINNGGTNAFDGENIIELLKTKRIVKAALFMRIPGSNQMLINLIAKEAGYESAWSENPYLKKKYPFPVSIGEVDNVQDSMISSISEFTVRNYIDISKVDKKMSFFLLKVTTNNEYISAHLPKALINEASSFYINTKTKAARENLMMLQHEADSLRRELGTNLYAAASGIDNTYNLNPALQTQRVSTQKSQIQLQVIGASYGEVTKNLELAKITLLKETPLYQIIDEPRLPLVKNRLGKIKTAIFALILGTLVASFCLIFLKIFRKLTSSF